MNWKFLLKIDAAWTIFWKFDRLWGSEKRIWAHFFKWAGNACKTFSHTATAFNDYRCFGVFKETVFLAPINSNNNYSSKQNSGQTELLQVTKSVQRQGSQKPTSNAGNGIVLKFESIIQKKRSVITFTILT